MKPRRGKPWSPRTTFSEGMPSAPQHGALPYGIDETVHNLAELGGGAASAGAVPSEEEECRLQGALWWHEREEREESANGTGERQRTCA